MRHTIICLLALISASVSAQNYSADWNSIDSRPTPRWFEDAKFGIFVCWGLYSVPSYAPTRSDGERNGGLYAEWYWNRLASGNKFTTEFHNRVYGENFRYQDFTSRFTAEMFDPDEWAGIFEGSGAGYVVLTSKFHDGFALWPSEYSYHWNSVEMGPHRDLAGELSRAVKARGLKMGFYYSLLEWENPLYRLETIDEYVYQHMMPQMKELVTKYHPDIVWPDGEWEFTSGQFHSTEFLRWLYNESPVKDSVAVNDRWGSDSRSRHGGYYTSEYDSVPSGNSNDVKFSHPWEECRGISGTFGLNRHDALEDYDTSEQLVHSLINKVARGGNLILDIGPTADGRIPVIMQQRLKDIGDWLRVNGEAIYGTRKWDGAPDITPESTVYFTVKGKNLYVIDTRWDGRPITVEGLPGVKKVSMLGHGGDISYSRSGNRLTIRPARITKPSDIPCDYAWVYKVSLESSLQ